MKPRPDSPTIHLYRGSPIVREWSRHQETDKRWTLCGVPRKATQEAPDCTEDYTLVTCRYCIDLLRPTAG